MKDKKKKGGRPKLANKVLYLQLPLRKEQLQELGGRKKAVKSIAYHVATVTSEKSQEIR